MGKTRDEILCECEHAIAGVHHVFRRRVALVLTKEEVRTVMAGTGERPGTYAYAPEIIANHTGYYISGYKVHIDG